ncbi:hypothetical protein SAMN02745673_01881 [Marinactinospora thermotolerans DSM 45154]|uniref:Uncharacterized protein n=1 Tax=Marinactinospora thermotolerans DSM 45154 TaxID=1122192 RepID=A0A1T4PMI2_9ACTN|nr:hypothetical protein SAMN02745673_01881 [Marinactinospora thermotolerans DSM 45154]
MLRDGRSAATDLRLVGEEPPGHAKIKEVTKKAHRTAQNTAWDAKTARLSVLEGRKTEKSRRPPSKPRGKRSHRMIRGGMARGPNKHRLARRSSDR